MNRPLEMTPGEHEHAAERSLTLAEQYVAEQKYDRVSAFSNLAVAHLLLAQAKRTNGR